MSEVFPQDQKFGWSEGLGGTSLSLSRLITSKSLSSNVSSVPQGGLKTFRRGWGVVMLQRSEGGGRNSEFETFREGQGNSEVEAFREGGGHVCHLCPRERLERSQGEKCVGLKRSERGGVNCLAFEGSGGRWGRGCQTRVNRVEIHRSGHVGCG